MVPHRLVKEEDGGYRIGSLDEKIYFTDNGILYRLPGRVLTLTPAKPADPALSRKEPITTMKPIPS